MTFLCILFLPPLYFLLRKKWGGFILNSILYGIGLICILTFVGIVIAPVFWLLAVGHASFAYRSQRMDQNADLIATKMAAKLQNVSKP